MAIRQVIKRAVGPGPVIGVCALLVASLSFLIFQSLSEDAPGQLQLWITALGGVGIATLLFFLLANCYALYRQYSRNEIGSKLTTKLVLIFLLLTLVPFSLIYYFAIQFLNKGVDSWFDVRVEQTVQDARFLGETWLKDLQNETARELENFANSLSNDIATGQTSQVLSLMDEVLELQGYTELGIYTDDGRVIAFSRADGDIGSTDLSAQILPDMPGPEVFDELRAPSQKSPTYVSLEPLYDQTQQIRIVTPINVPGQNSIIYALQATKQMPPSYGLLATSVENALSKYDQMVFARGPLRFSLVVTLSLISLASLLFSILTAVYLSKRLVAPISNLAAGTQKIAEGDYGTHLPITSADELGILTHSFNNMSSKIEEAQQAALISRLETERQRGYLEAVLTNLSSGVFSFDNDQLLQVSNSAASDILSVPHEQLIGMSADQIAERHPSLEKFVNTIQSGLASGQTEWQDEVTLLGKHGRQILIMRGTRIETPGDSNSQLPDNTVIVFDDVTNLIQAQRDAAWGEVARRLAHEIKNPLTPIQLSAERIHHKFSDQVDSGMRDTLERSTRTIVQQVESMKEMVNAFSSYAQPVRATLKPLNLNQLIRDVVELHTSTLANIEIDLQLQDDIPEIKANTTALRQVLNNLIINACHALEGNNDPKLMICTEPAPQVTGRYIDVIVADNGSGIPEDIRDSVFDPYVSSKAKGSGLGLAIVKRIVEEHSGSVWSKDSKLSNAQGNKGTAMHVRLPINAQQTYRGNRAQNTLHSAQG